MSKINQMVVEYMLVTVHRSSTTNGVRLDKTELYR